MAKIQGITITLITKTVVGKDPFGGPITQAQTVKVDNVLVAPVNSDDIVNHQTVTGKTAVYTLAIPKEDTHDWINAEVIFFGQRWRTIGVPVQGIEELIPLGWNKKVEVERYE